MNVKTKANMRTKSKFLNRDRTLEPLSEEDKYLLKTIDKVKHEIIQRTTRRINPQGSISALNASLYARSSLSLLIVAGDHHENCYQFSPFAQCHCTLALPFIACIHEYSQGESARGEVFVKQLISVCLFVQL